MPMNGSLRSGSDPFAPVDMDYYARTTQVPNAFFDLWLRELTFAELKLLLLVVRMTRGWVVHPSGKRKSRDWLSCSRIMTMTGLSDRAITTATSSLVARGLLAVTDAQGRMLSASYERRGRTRLYYGLGMDHDGPQGVRRRSESTAEQDPNSFRITKSTLTKPTLTKRNGCVDERDRSIGTHYSGPISGVLSQALAPSLWQQLASGKGRQDDPSRKSP